MSSCSLMTPDDLAKAWGVPKGHIYRLARDGLLPCVRLGRYVRFTQEAIEDFLANGGTEPTQ